MNDDIATVLGTDLRLEESLTREDDDAIMQEFYDAERRLQEVYGHNAVENLATYAVRCRMTAEEIAEWGRDPMARGRVIAVMKGEVEL